MDEGEIKGPTRSGPRSGWMEVVVAVVMIAVGALPVALHLIEPSREGGTRGLAFGGGFVMLLALGASVEIARNIARRRRAVAGGSEAWRADYDWPADGLQKVNTRSAAIVSAAAILGSLLPGLAILAMGLTTGGVVWMTVIGLAMIALMALVSWHQFGTPLVQCLRHGESRLRMPPVPAHLGEPTLVELETSADLGAPELTLRCIREEWVGSGKHRRKARYLVSYGRTSMDSQTTNGLQLHVEAPADAPATSLSEDPPRYWELEVKDKAAGFEALFLIPVYSRPALR